MSSIVVRTGERRMSHSRGFVVEIDNTVEIVVDGIIFKTDAPTKADAMRIAAQVAKTLGIGTAATP